MTDKVRAKLFKKLKVGGSLAFWQVKGEGDKSPFFFHAGMKVDADGAPNAYCPKGAKGGPGLDRLGNAGKKGNWWGVHVEKSGNPYVQKSGPYEGCYVSTTALVRAGKKDWISERNEREKHPKRSAGVAPKKTNLTKHYKNRVKMK